MLPLTIISILLITRVTSLTAEGKQSRITAVCYVFEMKDESNSRSDMGAHDDRIVQSDAKQTIDFMFPVIIKDC